MTNKNPTPSVASSPAPEPVSEKASAAMVLAVLQASTISCSGTTITIQCNNHAVKDTIFDWLTEDCASPQAQPAPRGMDSTTSMHPLTLEQRISSEVAGSLAILDQDREYASELLADLTNDDLPRQEIAARWFRKARVETFATPQNLAAESVASDSEIAKPAKTITSESGLGYQEATIYKNGSNPAPDATERREQIAQYLYNSFCPDPKRWADIGEPRREFYRAHADDLAAIDKGRP